MSAIETCGSMPDRANVRCELPEGHAGYCRSGEVVWNGRTGWEVGEETDPRNSAPDTSGERGRLAVFGLIPFGPEFPAYSCQQRREWDRSVRWWVRPFVWIHWES